jgi:protein arginine N-methyltransferase 1
MGYFLIYESMLETVLYARDKWLNKENGFIFPDKFSLYMAGFEDSYVKSNKLAFWKDVYGVNMECLGNMTFVEPIVEHIPPKNIVTSVCKFFEIDLYTC